MKKKEHQWWKRIRMTGLGKGRC